MELDLFLNFSSSHLNVELKAKWDKLYSTNKSSWEKIDIWDLWEEGNLNNETTHYEWEDSLDDLVNFLSNKTSKKYGYFIGLGHNFPFISGLPIEEIGSNLYKFLEGLLLFEDIRLAVAFNHDGDILILDNMTGPTHYQLLDGS